MGCSRTTRIKYTRKKYINGHHLKKNNQTKITHKFANSSNHQQNDGQFLFIQEILH